MRGRMRSDMQFSIDRIAPNEVATMRGLLAMFGTAFDDPEAYEAAPPSDAYLQQLLAGESFVAIAARDGDQVAGGLAAYLLPKFEQQRTEIYLYDLAVAERYRRRGIATALIEALKGIGAERGAYVIFVQADPGDAPAIALYTGLGSREDVLHFDIELD